ncbi:MAG: DUF2341 domain-containing protein [Candidatus Methanospirareceae archaeon]
MAKAISRIFEEIRGSIKHANKLTFRMHRSKIVLEKHPKPSYTRSELQDKVRKAYSQAVAEWNAMAEEEREQFRELAQRKNITLFNAFLSKRIKELLKGIEYEITIDNSANPNNLTDYQILLQITNDPQFFEDCKNNRVFLEFYDEDGITPLNHYVEEWDPINYNAIIWIKVPSIPANSTKKIYMRVNTERTEDLSNPEAVFNWFDDFEGTELDTNKWVLTSFNYSIGNSILTAKSGTLRTNIGVGSFPEHILEAKVRYIGSPNGKFGVFGATQDAGVDNAGSGSGDHHNYMVLCSYSDWYGWGWDFAGSYGRTQAPLSVNEWAVIGIAVGIQAYWFKNYQVQHTVSKVLSGAWRIIIGDDDAGGGEYPDMQFDWVRIRKFTDPEPSISYQKLS